VTLAFGVDPFSGEADTVRWFSSGLQITNHKVTVLPLPIPGQMCFGMDFPVSVHAISLDFSFALAIGVLKNNFWCAIAGMNSLVLNSHF
jgi:hypothetical protein